MRTRQRKCLGVSPIQSERRNCEGNSSQSQPCNVLVSKIIICLSAISFFIVSFIQFSFDKKCPRWGSWSSAESCSQTCGGGRMTYTRTCLQGSCEGESVSHRDCNEIVRIFESMQFCHFGVFCYFRFNHWILISLILDNCSKTLS